MELWTYRNEVARKLGDWVRATFRQADSTHKNIYENLATKEDVEDTIIEADKSINAIEEAIPV